jgi:hypothetical protein
LSRFGWGLSLASLGSGSGLRGLGNLGGFRFGCRGLRLGGTPGARGGPAAPGFFGRFYRGHNRLGGCLGLWFALRLAIELTLGVAIELASFLAIGLALEFGFAVTIAEFRFARAVFALVTIGVEVIGLTFPIGGDVDGILLGEGVFEPANGLVVWAAVIGGRSRAVVGIGVLGLRELLAFLEFAVAATATAAASASAAPAAFLPLAVAILAGDALIGASWPLSHRIAVYRGEIVAAALPDVGAMTALSIVGLIAALSIVAAATLGTLIAHAVVVSTAVGNVAMAALLPWIAPAAATIVRSRAVAVRALTIVSGAIVTLTIITRPIVSLTIVSLATITRAGVTIWLVLYGLGLFLHQFFRRLHGLVVVASSRRRGNGFAIFAILDFGFDAIEAVFADFVFARLMPG